MNYAKIGKEYYIIFQNTQERDTFIKTQKEKVEPSTCNGQPAVVTTEEIFKKINPQAFANNAVSNTPVEEDPVTEEEVETPEVVEEVVTSNTAENEAEKKPSPTPNKKK